MAKVRDEETDAWAYLDSKDKVVNKNMWYDLQTSILNSPVVNTENHIIFDSKQIDYSKKYADFVFAGFDKTISDVLMILFVPGSLNKSIIAKERDK